jgi:DNA-binding NarL/FixJ family response regulator
MSRVLIVDDNASTLELIAQAITVRLGHDVVLITDVDSVTPELCAGPGFDVALVDLSFRGTRQSGLDVLLRLTDIAPTTRLVLFTQGDDAVAQLMRDAWEALPLASAVSKSLPLELLVETIRRVVADGSAPPDPVLQPLLPAVRSPWRNVEGYRRLVHHAGHAKLWRALIDAGADPSYEELHRLSGLKVNTLRNYREQLVPELALHGMANPTMREMQAFAWRCGPLLAPYLVRSTAEAGSPVKP